MGSIYKITNTVNDKSYIGQTIHDAVKTRIRDHLRGKGSQPVKDAIEKYGKDAFTYEILHDGIIPEFLDTLEKEAIAKFNTIAPHGYNRNNGGSGSIKHSEEARQKMSESTKGENHPMYGKKHSDETKQKISEAHKGKTLSEEHRRKISEVQIGKSVSEETRRKMSENNAAKRPEVRRKITEANKRRVRKPHSEETKRKMSEAHKGRPAWNKGKSVSEETRRKMSESRKGEKNPNFGKTVSEETRQKISNALRGEKNPMYGKSQSEEHRRKRSNAMKGRTPWKGRTPPSYGKKCSEETKRKISEAKRSPYYEIAHKLFFSLPPNMDLKQKRRHLLEKFSDDVSLSTICGWIQKWHSELESKT